MSKKNIPPVKDLGRGQPPKAKFSDPDSIAERINLEISKFSAECANELPALYKVIMNTALGKDKNASITNKISCAKYCIEHAEKYLEEHYAEDEEELEREIPEAQKGDGVKKSSSLISLKVNNG